MKREDVKQQIAGITDEQLNWLMDEYGKGIKAEQIKYNDLKIKFDTANKQLETAQEGLKAFEGVDVAKLKDEVVKLTNQMNEQQATFAFDNMLDSAIRDMNGVNVTAIRSLLDIDTLKNSKNRDADIKTALEKCKEDNPWGFDVQTDSTKVKVDSGYSSQSNGNIASDIDGVEAAFMALNPTIKL